MRVRIPAIGGASRADAYRILLVFSLGLLLRLAWLAYARPVPVSDFWAYKILAEGLLEHHQFGYPEPTANRLPGYPAFLALSMLVDRGDFWLSFCNVLASSTLIALVYLLALRLSRGSRSVATLGALLCALYPTFVFLAPVLATEHLFSLLFVGSLLIMLEANWKALPRMAAAGLALGWAVLSRGEGVFYYPLYVVAIWTSVPGRLARWRSVLVLVLASAVVFAPWYLRNLDTFGPGIGLTVTAGQNFYFAHNPTGYGYVEHTEELEGLDHVQKAKRGWKLGFEYVRSDPSHLLRNLRVGTWQLYAALPSGLHWSTLTALYWTEAGWYQAIKEMPSRRIFEFLSRWSLRILLVLSISSLLFLRRLPVASWAILLMWVAANWFGFAILFAAMPRYRYVAEIAHCILASVTLSGSAHWIRERRLPSRAYS
jgi:hypothetical protein